MILPINDFDGNSEGENYVWRKFKELLPEDYVSFHNYYLGQKQVDIILLVPKLGALIIEIKGFLAKNIIEVPDNSRINLKNYPPIPSPLAQANRYRFQLIEILHNAGINSVYVPCSVCYPFLNKKEYESKHLNKISGPIMTITMEDLENAKTLKDKIEKIFEDAYEQINIPGLIKNGLDKPILNTVGNLVSPEFRSENKQGKPDSKAEKDKIKLVRRYYSKLIFINNEEIDKTYLEKMIHEWNSGTKFYVYVTSLNVLIKIRGEIEGCIKSMGLDDRKDFKFIGNSTFNFDLSLTEVNAESFEIINGSESGKYTNQLVSLNESSSFNLGQYSIEHAKLEDIIVKAGAGTGKTYVIISRIQYLIWEKGYDTYDLKRAIIMITFTNESAQAMKEKLADSFLNIYLLTKNNDFLDFIEAIEDMNISTIHALSKNIIKKYGYVLGLGREFSITTGKYKRKEILHKHINDFVEKNKEIEDKIEISMYDLQERLLHLLEKLDDKNVEISDKDVDFGNPNNKIFNKLIEELKSTQVEMNEYCDTNNSVSLGNLIKKLRILLTKLQENPTFQKDNIDFLFVDEFQDTDDVQIQLMKDFRKQFNYKFFVVGDIKQCIYRFRGAQVKAFDTLDNENQFTTVSLNKNYRTDSNLMKQMNKVFRAWNNNGDIDYSEEDILIGTKLLCDSTELYNIKVFSDPQFEKKLVDTLRQYIPSLENENDKIAILVRYNWQVNNIKEICKKAKINIETEIGGDLFRIDPTIDLFKLVLALKHNRWPKYLYNLYTTSYIIDELEKNSLVGLNEEEIVELFYNNLPKNLNKWNKYISRLTEEPALKVIRDIVNDTKPWETFAIKSQADGLEEIERLESYYIRNLDQLFEKLIIASNTDYITINKLSDYLEIMILTKQEEEARESYDIEKSKAKAICTTVHKAKGLEFDTILLPYCNFDISSARAKGEVDLIYSKNEVGYRITGRDYKIICENNHYENYQKDEIIDRRREETRILYVAITRAIKRIIYISYEVSKKKTKYNWSKMISGVQE
ncbi:MAG: UvrD-helicase domain-containing protein [Bacteroidota bacterium]